MSEPLNQLDLQFDLCPGIPGRHAESFRRGQCNAFAGEVIDHAVHLALSTAAQQPDPCGFDRRSVLVGLEKCSETGVVELPGLCKRGLVAGCVALERFDSHGSSDDTFQSSVDRLLCVVFVGECKLRCCFLPQKSGPSNTTHWRGCFSSSVSRQVSWCFPPPSGSR